MTEEGWGRLPEIVAVALELSGEARAAYLGKACGGDHELRQEVERLLANAKSGGQDFLEPPPQLGRGELPRMHLLGEFELLRELGRGGMGVVYLARQPRLSREVAIKVLVEGLTTTERDVERFHREALATARLRHPGIVQVFADGQAGANHWFAMEYVAGHDLRRELQLQRSGAVLESDQPFLPRPDEPEHVTTIARLCAEVADALQHAHGQGLVHRDVKPHNLLLQPDGRVQIGDFGLARDESLGSITRTGDLAGTPHYMSPEQARVHASRVDHRTDVYSLGVVLYELATLQRPFEGRTSADVITKIRDAEPRSVRALNHRVPRDLETICRKAMAKDPRDRYQSAAELRDDLRRFLAHEAILALPPTWIDHARRSLHRHRRRIAAAGLLVGGLVLGALVAARTVEARGMARLSAEAVDVDGTPLEGRVHLRALDSITGAVGPREELGALPLEERAVPPGYYRVVIDVDGAGPRELTRELRAATPQRVEARVRPDQPGDDGMVFVPGGMLAIEGERANPPSLRYREVAVEGFWIDRTEVSNREYRAFLDATGHPPPVHWNRIVPGEHDDLPVVYVGWEDARAYAEWVGKRLPWLAEALYAASGAEGRSLPWADAVPGQLRGNVFGPDLPPRGPELEWTLVDEYLARTEPVDSNPDAATPLGVLNLYGNVAEWTETMFAEPIDGIYHLRPGVSLYLSSDWRSALYKRDAHSCGWESIESAYAMPTVGFRCARSAQP